MNACASKGESRDTSGRTMRTDIQRSVAPTGAEECCQDWLAGMPESAARITVGLYPLQVDEVARRYMRFSWDRMIPTDL